MPSTVIRRFDYDEETRVLRVTFQSGDVYAYFDVPPELPADWRAAFSKGRFFAARVRDRYAFERRGAETPDHGTARDERAFGRHA